MFLKFSKAGFLILASLCLLFGLPEKSFAQFEPNEPMEFLPVTISNLNININIQKNGSAKVSENFNLGMFESQNFAFILPREKVSQIEVYQGGVLYKNYRIRRTSDAIILTNLIFSGENWLIKFNIASLIKAKDGFDEFRYESASSGNYVENLNIKVSMPQAVQNVSDLSAIHYAIHGVGEAESKVLNSSTLEYNAKILGPFSSFTAVARIPKGIIKFPFFTRIDNFFSNLSGATWLILSLLLPIITFVIMGFMLNKKKREENILPSTYAFNAPPEKISPAAVGVLFNSMLSAREIAATIIDMAARGFLFIVNGGPKEGYRFGERKSFLTLAPHEQDLGKELLRGGLRRTVKEIEEEPQAEIFSATVSLVYRDIYRDVARLGYFVEDPTSVHLRYYFGGMIIFAASIIGFIIAAAALPYPPYPIFGFFAMTFSSLVVMKMSRQMPIRTAAGRESLSKWLAFRNYLVSYPGKTAQDLNENIYFQYLPYAVVLGVEKKWADHFALSPFKNPEWYAAFQEFNSVPQFSANFYPMIDYIADIMESLKEPTIK